MTVSPDFQTAATEDFMTTTLQHPVPLVPAVRVADLVREDLTDLFPGGVFSVRTTRCRNNERTVIVNWYDGPTEEQVEQCIGHYRGRPFDMSAMRKKQTPTRVTIQGRPVLVQLGNADIDVCRELTDEGTDRVLDMIAEDNPWRTFTRGFLDEAITDHEQFAPPPGAWKPMFCVTGADLFWCYERSVTLPVHRRRRRRRVARAS